jgi:hypothetical protein
MAQPYDSQPCDNQPYDNQPDSNQPYSQETQELLDRAQSAIDRSIDIRNDHAIFLEVAKRKAFDIELQMYRVRVEGLTVALKK